MKIKEIVEVIEPKDIFTGDANAPVTITQFGDYESDACAETIPVITKLLDVFAGNVKFVFRHFPLLKIHQKAHKAAEAAIGAGQEGKFWEMHNELFANKRNLGVISLKAHAREAGVINKKFLDELINGTYGVYVQDDLREGIKLGVKTVPAFFINGQKFEQDPTFKNLSTHIQGLLDKKKAKSKVTA